MFTFRIQHVQACKDLCGEDVHVGTPSLIDVKMAKIKVGHEYSQPIKTISRKTFSCFSLSFSSFSLSLSY